MTLPLMIEILAGYVLVCCLALWLASKILP
jgi:hypothetical protein